MPPTKAKMGHQALSQSSRTRSRFLAHHEFSQVQLWITNIRSVQEEKAKLSLWALQVVHAALHACKCCWCMIIAAVAALRALSAHAMCLPCVRALLREPCRMAVHDLSGGARVRHTLGACTQSPFVHAHAHAQVHMRLLLPFVHSHHSAVMATSVICCGCSACDGSVQACHACAHCMCAQR